MSEPTPWLSEIFYLTLCHKCTRKATLATADGVLWCTYHFNRFEREENDRFNQGPSDEYEGEEE